MIEQVCIFFIFRVFIFRPWTKCYNFYIYNFNKNGKNCGRKDIWCAKSEIIFSTLNVYCMKLRGPGKKLFIDFKRQVGYIYCVHVSSTVGHGHGETNNIWKSIKTISPRTYNFKQYTFKVVNLISDKSHQSFFRQRFWQGETKIVFKLVPYRKIRLVCSVQKFRKTYIYSQCL
jgi:hypothetical protein